MRRLSERLSRLDTRPSDETEELPPTPEPTLHAPGTLEALRDWWRPDTPHGPATIARDSLLASDYLQPRHVAGQPCHHALDRILGDARLEGFSPEQALYLDIEATGLSHGAGTFAFLIGCAWIEGDAVVMEQLFVPDPTDELPALSRFLDLLESRPYLVSFNGKSYDLSVLESRLVITRLLSRVEASIKLRPHLDLLHVSRQAYKGVFGDTRLQTLERTVLNLDPKEREDDVPGSLVPALYFHYLRTGYAPHLDPVLKHNRTDVLSMVSLAAHLVALMQAPAGDPGVLLNLGRAALSRGLPDRAARLLASALEDGLHGPDERLALEGLVTAARRAGNASLQLLATSRLLDLLHPSEDVLRTRLTRLHQRLSRPAPSARPGPRGARADAG